MESQESHRRRIPVRGGKSKSRDAKAGEWVYLPISQSIRRKARDDDLVHCSISTLVPLFFCFGVVPSAFGVLFHLSFSWKCFNIDDELFLIKGRLL